MVSSRTLASSYPPNSVAAIGQGFGNDLRDMSPPAFQPVLALSQKVMALIDSRNPRDRAGLMIEDFVRNVGRNTKPGHWNERGI